MENNKREVMTETCPYCNHTIEMDWDANKNGYEIFCPYCGRKIMLCGVCKHDPAFKSCDYDPRKETCFRCKEEQQRRLQSKMRALIEQRYVRTGMDKKMCEPAISAMLECICAAIQKNPALAIIAEDEKAFDEFLFHQLLVDSATKMRHVENAKSTTIQPSIDECIQLLRLCVECGIAQYYADTEHIVLDFLYVRPIIQPIHSAAKMLQENPAARKAILKMLLKSKCVDTACFA